MNGVVAPSVKKYLQEKGLPLKCLLLLDISLTHPPGLEEDLVKEFDFIQVKFLQPNMTPILQPIDQQVISIFFELHIKGLYGKSFEITNDIEFTLRVLERPFSYLECHQSHWQCMETGELQKKWILLGRIYGQCLPDQDVDGFEANSGTARHSPIFFWWFYYHRWYCDHRTKYRIRSRCWWYWRAFGKP